MEHSIPERLARVETSLDGLSKIVNATATDVRAMRDSMLTSTASKAGSWKTLSTLGSAIVGVGIIAGGVGAMAAVLIR